MGRRRVDLQEAAELLGITSDAVRKRAKRGTMPYETGADGKLYVWIDTGRTGPDAGRTNDNNINNDSDPRDELIAMLKEQLEAEREANRENRRLLAAALERIPAIESPEATESPPETAEPRSDTDTPADVREAQEGAQTRRSWWRRWLGF